MIDVFWKNLKVQRQLKFGPVALRFQFLKSFPVRAPKYGHGLLERLESSAPAPNSSTPAIQKEPGPGVALVIGAGPGLGEALAEKLAESGFDVALAARDGPRLEQVASRLKRFGGQLAAYGCDVTSEQSVATMFSRLDKDLGTPRLVVYSLQNFGPGETLSIEIPAFEDGWRHNCLGAFLVAKQACRRMAEAGEGTLILIGSTSSLIGRAGHLNLAAGKFGQRALSQVLAKEMWKKGIHVVHVIIDADIKEHEEIHPQADPADIAHTLLFLYRQPKSAWTSEIDLRPWNETFWEHC